MVEIVDQLEIARFDLFQPFRLVAAGAGEIGQLATDQPVEPAQHRIGMVGATANQTVAKQAEHVILLGPPGIGKTHIAIGLGAKAAHAGYSVLFDTASNWIARLGAVHHAGRIEAELKKIRRYKLIIDEVLSQEFDAVLVS